MAPADEPRLALKLMVHRISEDVDVFESGMDLAYRPWDEEGWAWLAAARPETILVLGTLSDDQARRVERIQAGEARTFASGSARRLLHDGFYLAKVDGFVASVISVASKTSAIPIQARLRTDDTHLGAAYDLYQDHWVNATELLGSSKFAVGDLVRPRSGGAFGRVRRLVRRQDNYEVEAEFGAGVQNFVDADLESVPGDPSTPDFWLQLAPGTADETATFLSWLKLSNPLTDTLYSYAATKTTFQPYQFIPALKILTSATGRLLIADEVGLGKTIEAGLIWTELEQRTRVRRALVVVPAALQFKWKQEMERRFMRPLPLLKREDLREFILKLRDDQDPDLIGVISIDALRGASDLLADLAELNPHFDLVIVDEAHILRNKSTRSYQLGSLLSDLADYLVFLSATPLNLGSHDLFNLVNLLDEGGFPDAAVFEGQLEPNRALNALARNMADPGLRSRELARRAVAGIPAMTHGAALAKRPDFARLLTLLSGDAPIGQSEVAAIKRIVSELNTLGGVLSRTRKTDVPNRKAKRIAESIPVNWTDRERSFYDAVFEFYRGKAVDAGVPTGFAMQMPLRQASSCLVVAQGRLLNREDWLEEAEDTQFDFNEDEARTNTILSPPPTSTLASPLGPDSKLSALMSRLHLAQKNGMPKALIFSFFRGTADYLAASLQPDFRTRALHGGIPIADRQAIIDDFRAGKFDVLISTQVGSEGLDFEFCNVLVNYDLPWNPMQVEQRIGRLDRFGQLFEKIFIFNMHVPGTIESDIIERLYQRIGVFENSIGDLEPIMHSTMKDISQNVLNPRLSHDEMTREMDRVAVATERRKEELRQLEQSSAVLTTVSQLDIDGLTPDGPTSGRYIGASELERLLRLVVSRYGGSVSNGSTAGTLVVRGSHDLAVALRELPRDERGTMYGIGKLVGQLRDGIALTVAVTPTVAVDVGCELVSSRHPLIGLAIHVLSTDSHLLRRYGAVTLSNSMGRRYIARIDIARSTGVRDVCEIWVTAVDIETGERAEYIEDRLMVDVAEGTLGDAAARGSSDLTSVLRIVDNLVSSRRSVERLERMQDNSALVDARIQSERHSISIKLERAREQLRAHQAKHSDSSLRRMHEGRIRNLTTELEDIARRLEQKRNLTMSVERAATVFVVA